jgi:S-DNA-T family DNA segregation ATPase FtsK/SpoIIIE
LLTPVVTDITKAVNALRWAIQEMDKRFDILAKAGVRNIATFNQNAETKMPYLVIVIDELADLMITASNEVEASIIRLTQMARAVGIHLILATQRPSVDVITGLIKANVPARIAFSVASSMDSRTILDGIGAEKLIGKGDMLFQTAELGKPRRIQGAFIGDDEIKRVANFLQQAMGEPEYDSTVTEKQSGKNSFSLNNDDNDGGDELLDEAREMVVKSGKASASYLQRRFRIGYARAARLIDLLEDNGVVGPGDGARPREVLITMEELKDEPTPTVFADESDAEAAGEDVADDDDTESLDNNQDNPQNSGG